MRSQMRTRLGFPNSTFLFDVRSASGVPDMLSPAIEVRHKHKCPYKGRLFAVIRACHPADLRTPTLALRKSKTENCTRQKRSGGFYCPTIRERQYKYR